MKTAAAYAGPRAGTERETLRQTPHPKLRTPRGGLAHGSEVSRQGHPWGHAKRNPTPGALPPPAASRMRSAGQPGGRLIPEAPAQAR